jgi:hypothetical protein
MTSLASRSSSIRPVRRRRLGLAAAWLALAAVWLPAWAAPLGGPTTELIRFDNTFAELGVTPQGTTAFSIFGSHWSGGLVISESILSLYASIPASWRTTASGDSQVSFDELADGVSFFFVHKTVSAEATVLDAEGQVLGTLTSLAATTLNDPANFVSLDPTAGIAKIVFSGASYVDDFAFLSTGVVTPVVAVLVPGQKVNGILAAGSKHELFIDAVAGTLLTLKLSRKGKGNQLQPGLRLLDAERSELLAQEDTAVSVKAAGFSKFELPSTGTYIAEITAVGKAGGGYRLKSKAAPPKGKGTITLP